MKDDLITQFVPDERPPAADADGLVRHRRGAYLVGHAQRVAEGVNLEIHRNTWRYTRLLEHQRELILEWRDKVLHGDAAAKALAEADPERWAERLRTPETRRPARSCCTPSTAAGPSTWRS